MYINEDTPLQKIRDPKIRMLAEAGAETEVDVLIELDLPVSPLRVERDVFSATPQSLSVEGSGGSDSSDAFERFGDFLGTRSTRPPVPLRGAHAYAARLPARSLAEVIRTPLVSAVVLNRHLQVV
jgi:hypothetical protein